MALQLLFNRNTRKGFVNPGDVGGAETIALELDAILSESPEYNATPTKSPVETGANVTDHVTLDSERLMIEGIVSNTPISLLRILSGVTFDDPAADAFSYLEELYKNRQPFDFVGDLKIYENMIITSFNPSKTPSTGQTLQFTIAMEQIQFVDSQLVAATYFAENVEHTAPGKQDIGSQAVEEATEKAQTQATSLLARLSDAIF